MDTKGTCILVLDNDLPCNNVVGQMLQLCNYQVLHVGSILDVLNAIWETKNRLDLVLTNVHKLYSNGTVIIEHIHKKLNLPVVLMCNDKTKISSKGQELTFAAYVVEGLTRSKVNSLWQFALGQEEERVFVAGQEENVRKSSVCYNIAVEKNKTCAPVSETELFDQKRKRKELGKSKTEVMKKPRVVWTREMHQKFLEAIEIIGYDKAVPKKIVEVMGIQGLSRENVASHLQKFRGSTKRAQEIERYIGVAKSYNHLYIQNEMKNRLSKTLTGKNKSFVDYNGQPMKSGNFVGYRLTENGNTIKFGNLEDGNRGKRFSLLHLQDFSAQSATEKTGNDFQVQNSDEFSQMAQCFDDFLDEAMLKGEGDECWPLDWEEFGDNLFDHDD